MENDNMNTTYCKNNCYIIGVGGVTNGGKTTLCDKLRSSFTNIDVIHMDDYYWPEDSNHLEILPQFNYANWDVVSAVDRQSLLADVQSWLSRANSPQVSPRILLVEGIVLYDCRELLPYFTKKYYLQLTKEQCWERRSKRTYLPPEPPGYFDAVVWPEYLVNCESIRQRSDIICLDGATSADELFKRVLMDLVQLLELVAPPAARLGEPLRTEEAVHG